MAASAGSVFELIVDDLSPPLPHPRRDFAQSENRPADVPIDWQMRSSAASTFGHTAPTAAAAASQLCMLNRSEGRSVGKECVQSWRIGWALCQYTKKTQKKIKNQYEKKK